MDSNRMKLRITREQFRGLYELAADFTNAPPDDWSPKQRLWALAYEIIELSEPVEPIRCEYCGTWGQEEASLATAKWRDDREVMHPICDTCLGEWTAESGFLELQPITQPTGGVEIVDEVPA